VPKSTVFEPCLCLCPIPTKLVKSLSGMEDKIEQQLQPRLSNHWMQPEASIFSTV